MRICRLGMLAALVVAVPAQAEVKDSSASGFSIENSVLVATPRDRVWQAMTGQIDRWWPKGHSWWGPASTLGIDARAGGCFCEIAGARQAQHLQVSFVDPGTTLRMLGGLGPLQGMGLHGVAEWTLRAEGEGTRITWTYRVGGYTPQDLSTFAPVVDRVQAQQLDGLLRFLAQP